MEKKLTSKSILHILQTNMAKIRGYGVKKIGLFGSFASGKQGRDSDLDILVTFANPTFDNYMELKFYLEKLFAKKVDPVTESSLKPALRYVKREAIYAEAS